MFAGPELRQLQEARNRLVLQAQTHRDRLRAEGAAWVGRLERLRAVQQQVSAFRPILMVGALLGGLVAAKRGRSLFQWFPRAFTAWRWLRGLWAR